ncbi:MAG: anti-sigma factor [Planctomycetota bacterium]
MTDDQKREDRARDERYLDLALERAGQGLDPPEAADFERLAAEAPSASRREAASYELTAAQIHFASLRPLPLRADLRKEIVEDGVASLGDPAVAASRPTWIAPFHWLGWVAAAAALLFAFSIERSEPESLSTAARVERLASAPDARTLPWSATEDPAAAGASGDVVWSTERQAGFMRIRGLAPNDPTAAQYQLWIFDATRTEENSVAGAGAIPVDGGVFDVTAGELVVPITPKLPVGQPTLFAVTVERPGGVTVSRQERIVLAAAVD